jgi:hypothetical protein
VEPALEEAHKRQHPLIERNWHVVLDDLRVGIDGLLHFGAGRRRLCEGRRKREQFVD